MTNKPETFLNPNYDYEDAQNEWETMLSYYLSNPEEYYLETVDEGDELKEIRIHHKKTEDIVAFFDSKTAMAVMEQMEKREKQMMELESDELRYQDQSVYRTLVETLQRTPELVSVVTVKGQEKNIDELEADDEIVELHIQQNPNLPNSHELHTYGRDGIVTMINGMLKSGLKPYEPQHIRVYYSLMSKGKKADEHEV